MTSIQTDRFIAEALEEAGKSKVMMKHGCVAVINGKIRARGYNSTERTSSKDNFIKNTCSCHAEMACLRNLYNSLLTQDYGKYDNCLKGYV